MKKVIILSVVVAVVIMSVAITGCSGKSIYDYETVSPSHVTTAAQLMTDENGKLVETTAPIEIPDTTEPSGDTSADTTIPPDETAPAGTLVGAWVGTYKNGSYTLTITAEDSSSNKLTLKFSGGGLPNATDGYSLLVETDSFKTDVFGISVKKNGKNIEVSASDGLSGYSGKYSK